jgi:hypothetical protein
MNINVQVGFLIASDSLGQHKAMQILRWYLILMSTIQRVRLLIVTAVSTL